MSIPVVITNGLKSQAATIFDPATEGRDGDAGLTVYTEPRRILPITSRPLSSAVGSLEMAVSVGFSGTPDLIHDGTDSALWTASALSGVWAFADTSAAKQGVTTVIDYTGLSGDTLTINGDGFANTVLTEGVEWTAATNNNTTAASLQSAIDAITGLTATVVSAVIEVTADSGSNITAFTSSDGANLSAQAASIDGTGAVKNSELQVERSSAIDSSAYIAFCGSIRIVGWPQTGTKDVEVRLRLAGANTGVSVNLSAYISTTNIGGWQNFIIPIADFGSSATIDQIVFLQIDTGAGVAPTYNLDSLSFQEAGGFTDFTYRPNNNERFGVKSFALTITDAYTGTLSDNSMPNLSYNKLLNQPKLDNGILTIAQSGGELLPSQALTQLRDFMVFPPVTLESYGDGTNAVLKITSNFIFDLDGRQNDFFTYRVQDDLSGLISFNTWFFGTLETF